MRWRAIRSSPRPVGLLVGTARRHGHQHNLGRCAQQPSAVSARRSVSACPSLRPAAERVAAHADHTLPRSNVPSGDPAEDGVLVASSKFASKCRACQNTIDIGDSAWCVQTAAQSRGPILAPAFRELRLRLLCQHTLHRRGHSGVSVRRTRPVAHSTQGDNCAPFRLSRDPFLPSRFQRDGEPGRKTTCVACHKLKTAAADTAPDPEKPAEKPKKTTVKRPRPQTKVRPQRSHALRCSGNPTPLVLETVSHSWCLDTPRVPVAVKTVAHLGGGCVALLSSSPRCWLT